MLPVAMVCPFLIAPSVFSNVYLLSSLSRNFWSNGVYRRELI